GRINNMGNYEHASMFCTANVQEHLLNYLWNYDLNNYDENRNKLFTAKFFGDTSDAYSFAEFDMEIAPDTKAGTYPVNFMTNPEDFSESTYITCDDSYPDLDNPPYYVSVSSEMIPALQGAEIIVEPPPQLETEIIPIFRNAEDSQEFSLQDFPEEVTISESGISKTVKTEELVNIFETGSPASLLMEEPSKILQSELVFDEVNVLDSNGNPAVLEYWIAHKGDVNLDGAVNAKDAALILVYAADAGAGNEAFLTESHDAQEEQFAYFLADIDGEGKEDSPLNAIDASKIMIYSAMCGSGNQPDWKEIM
ncbi:MAG: dockerin type I repeat-containing protein, partial [Oscillospiraceae bacterium]|nr:dockerin type I repeat-containing protein [Oscillospiraceae bacterium]